MCKRITCATSSVQDPQTRHAGPTNASWLKQLQLTRHRLRAVMRRLLVSEGTHGGLGRTVGWDALGREIVDGGVTRTWFIAEINFNS